MTSTKKKCVLGRISDVNAIMSVNGNVCTIALTFEREDGSSQMAKFVYDEHFRDFMLSCNALSTEDLYDTVCKLFLSNDINPVITKIRTVFTQPVELETY